MSKILPADLVLDVKAEFQASSPRDRDEVRYSGIESREGLVLRIRLSAAHP